MSNQPSQPSQHGDRRGERAAPHVARQRPGLLSEEQAKRAAVGLPRYVVVDLGPSASRATSARAYALEGAGVGRANFAIEDGRLMARVPASKVERVLRALPAITEADPARDPWQATHVWRE